MKIRVEDVDNIRSLYFGDTTAVQSAIDLRDDKRLVLDYVKYINHFVSKPVTANVKLATILGLGGGTLSRVVNFHRPNAFITTVDNNPEVLQVAKRDFGFVPSEKNRVVISDAFEYVSKNREASDLLIVDVFDEYGHILDYCSTDFFKACKKHLRRKGVVLLNAWGIGNSYYENMQNDFAKVFGDIGNMPCDEKGYNVLLIGVR